MRLMTLWEESCDETEMPWLVAAVDEYTIEANDGLPERYMVEYEKRTTARRRELVIEISDDAVLKLFMPPVVKGKQAEPPGAADK